MTTSNSPPPWRRRRGSRPTDDAPQMSARVVGAKSQSHDLTLDRSCSSCGYHVCACCCARNGQPAPQQDISRAAFGGLCECAPCKRARARILRERPPPTFSEIDRLVDEMMERANRNLERQVYFGESGFNGLKEVIPASPAPAAEPDALPPGWELEYGDIFVHTLSENPDVHCFLSNEQETKGQWFWHASIERFGYAPTRNEAMARALGWERRGGGSWHGHEATHLCAIHREVADTWTAFNDLTGTERYGLRSLPHAIAWCRGECDPR